MCKLESIKKTKKQDFPSLLRCPQSGTFSSLWTHSAEMHTQVNHLVRVVRPHGHAGRFARILRNVTRTVRLWKMSQGFVAVEPSDHDFCKKRAHNIFLLQRKDGLRYNSSDGIFSLSCFFFTIIYDDVRLCSLILSFQFYCACVMARLQ